MSKSLDAQTIKQIEQITNRHQKCLDSGVNMLKCSQNYYRIMDSMLNVVYNNLRIKLNNRGENKLKRSQLKWLLKRDIFFKKQDNIFIEKTKKEYWGEDMEMITIDNKTEFVKNRAIYLIKYKF